jgi:sugar/nucleoside kinase (ribokinase family)
LKRCKENDAITLIGTASDPKYRKKKKWILGDNEESYKYIDILMLDCDEAIGYAGSDNFQEIKSFFVHSGVSCFIITNGANPVYLWSKGTSFFNAFDGYIPVAKEIDEDKKLGKLPKGDSIGCGDNFTSGILTSIIMQKQAKIEKKIDLFEAVLFANICGGITSTIIGGTFSESYNGEKMDLCQKYFLPYRNRVMKMC